MSMPGRVIILNGVSSVGKSSVVKALQAIAHEPYLDVAMDTFLSMLPERSFGRDGLIFEPVELEGHRQIAISTGPTAARALRGMRHAVASLAAEGNNLIVDEVMFGPETAQEYRALLEGHDLRFVGLSAPLDVIEARERARGDREIGLARWQYHRVHEGIEYDLELDTSTSTPLDSARRIKKAFQL